MDILNFILYGIFFTTGFLSADFVVKKFSPQFFIEIQTRTKRYKTKIHHLYLSIAGILTYFFDVYILTFFFIGIGVHDAITEIRKKLKEKLNKR
ncbi:hypothetical protein YN1_4270 [Nanoarchaeota archaeon]